LLVVAASALLAAAAPASSSGICDPIKATVEAQLQVLPGTLVLQGSVEGVLGGRPALGSSVTQLSTPIQGIAKVENPVSTEGGSSMEVFDEAKTEPPRSIASTVEGMLIPTLSPNRFLLVLHARVTEDGSGEIHYQGTLDLSTSTAAWELSGGVCH
jgi:hypothetical protein